MLRNPAARVVSGYYFARRRPQHYLYEPIVGNNLDIERFVSGGITTETDNGQLRLLTGHIDDIEIGGCTRQLLEQAKTNLIKHFAAVGLAERFDESLLLIKKSSDGTDCPCMKSGMLPNKDRPSCLNMC